ncbi:hypothetical protein [Burkholderia vietnamiensis]|uniref:hypothetical protein n=1 Tax=Burkholderia vietnamiensis TaxID=60552 RepID=UPI0009BD370A|nr:hypothetical protein [Burkholderia vietnamiensis]MDN8069666.1 hypothetical protein [Burkholderia vietnamiensis]
MPQFVPNEILEQLAAAEHERWAHWQRYMHSKAIQNSDGSLTIPAELVSRWERLMNTPYAELTENERQSDREQVQRYLPLLTKIETP